MSVRVKTKDNRVKVTTSLNEDLLLEMKKEAVELGINQLNLFIEKLYRSYRYKKRMGKGKEDKAI
jgi:hypothetical protein